MAIRFVFAGALFAGLLVGLVFVGARCAISAFDDEPVVAAPTAAAEPGSPGATAEAFAKAWTEGDINALFLLLSADAQRANPPTLFAETYSRFALEMTQVSLKASVREARDGSAMLAVQMATSYFGDREYEAALNLSRVPGGWAVDWTPASIHPEMVDGREFKSIIQRPSRGSILDRDGVELAVTRDVRYLGLNRSLVRDQPALRTALLEFGFSEDAVNAAFGSSAGANQRVKVGEVSDAQADAASLTLRQIPGVILYFESQRVHPLGAAAAHVVGYTRELTAEELAPLRGTGLRPGDRVGATGLEASQDKVLAGSIGAELQVVDLSGAVVTEVVARPFVPGQDVVTTLDADVLQTAHARLGSRAGAAVVIDPVTNGILALNSSPSFDPDAFERNDGAALAAITSAPNGPLANRATTGLYSAGSTFKLVTGAAGLVSGGYSVTDRFECGAIWTGVDPPRRNWEGGQGQLTIAEGLMRSCNPVFYEIGLTLYNDTEGALSEMARLFGFGVETGVMGLYEEAGQVPDAQQKKADTGLAWFPGDEVNLAIGQGDLLITPLQLANAYSTFVARQLRTPKVLQSAPAPERGALPLSDAQWAHLMNGLQLVTSARGTASAAFALAGYNNFAGKSGTAEDANEQQHVLFVAMAPASSPGAVAAVVLDDGESGSIEAGPMARDMVLAALR